MRSVPRPKLLFQLREDDEQQSAKVAPAKGRLHDVLFYAERLMIALMLTRRRLTLRG